MKRLLLILLVSVYLSTAAWAGQEPYFFPYVSAFEATVMESPARAGSASIKIRKIAQTRTGNARQAASSAFFCRRNWCRRGSV